MGLVATIHRTDAVRKPLNGRSVLVFLNGFVHIAPRGIFVLDFGRNEWHLGHFSRYNARGKRLTPFAFNRHSTQIVSITFASKQMTAATDCIISLSCSSSAQNNLSTRGTIGRIQWAPRMQPSLLLHSSFRCIRVYTHSCHHCANYELHATR